MKQIYGEFLHKIQRAPTVYSFRFRLEEKINFIPGQFMEVIFDAQDKQLRHSLSFSSSPTKEYIEFTKRITSSRFSQKLLELKERDKVLFRLPLGNCVYKYEYKSLGFIIGGIGITPVISILEYLADKGPKKDCFLIYTNKNEEEIAFRKELKDWTKHLPLKVLYLIEDDRPSSENVQVGLINASLLSQYKEDLKQRINFVFGPPRMVTAVADLLKELGIPEERIEMEKFLGY